MSTNSHQKKLQMIYKVTTYVLIVLGGTISGALVGSVTGPIDIRLSVDNMGTMGSCIGAILAVVGCRFAMEHHEAMERNRDLFRALDGRLSRVARDSERATLGTPPNPRSV
jgi:hypothetical protein